MVKAFFESLKSFPVISSTLCCSKSSTEDKSLWTTLACVHDDSWNLIVNDSFKNKRFMCNFSCSSNTYCTGFVQKSLYILKWFAVGESVHAINSDDVIGCGDIGVRQHWLVAYKGESGRCFCGAGVRFAGPWRISVLTSVKHKAHVNIITQIGMGVIHITTTKRTVHFNQTSIWQCL